MRVRTLLYKKVMPGPIPSQINIIQVSSLNEIDNLLKLFELPEGETLVVFDIDHTLLKWGKEGIEGPVETGTKSFVEHIQQYVPAIALTNSSVESNRNADLNKAAIAFAGKPVQAFHRPAMGSFGPQLQSIWNSRLTFNRLHQRFGSKQQIPEFRDGILISGEFRDRHKTKVYGITKGQLLGEFLDFIFVQTGWRPRYVYMVDDVRFGMQSVEKEMNERGILFTGFWYGKLGHSETYRHGYYLPNLVITH